MQSWKFRGSPGKIHKYKNRHKVLTKDLMTPEMSSFKFIVGLFSYSGKKKKLVNIVPVIIGQLFDAFASVKYQISYIVG